MENCFCKNNEKSRSVNGTPVFKDGVLKGTQIHIVLECKCGNVFERTFYKITKCSTCEKHIGYNIYLDKTYCGSNKNHTGTITVEFENEGEMIEYNEKFIKG